MCNKVEEVVTEEPGLKVKFFKLAFTMKNLGLTVAQFKKRIGRVIGVNASKWRYLSHYQTGPQIPQQKILMKIVMLVDKQSKQQLLQVHLKNTILELAGF